MSTDSSGIAWRSERVLIIGRAAPEPSKKHIETVCTGGITATGELLRLYPISWRYLETEKRYKQWTWAKFEITKNPADKRKESYKVKEGSIEILGRIEDWSERLSFLEKAIVPDRETLEKLYRKDWTSIGIVEIELIEFHAEIQKKDWERDKPHIKQFLLYADRKPLEQLPIELRIKFKCRNNPQCRTHDCSLIGWEYLEAFRNFRKDYGSSEGAIIAIKDALSRRFNDNRRKSYALMATHSRYPVWMVAELYFIEKDLPKRLF